MRNAHHDPDFGYTHVHIDDHGDITLHLDSKRTGHTMIPLGICAVDLARDILRLAGHTDHETVQTVAEMITARAAADDALSLQEMHAVGATLRSGIPMRSEPSNVVHLRTADMALAS